MVNRRPTAEQIAARKWEIRRRYSTKAKVGKRTRSMAAIRLADLTRWYNDVHGAGAELEPSERSIEIIRIFAHHMGALPDAPRRIMSWLLSYAPWLEHIERERLISQVVQCPIKWSADKLAWKIRLSDDQRTKLKITTIGAIDCSKEQRAQRRIQRRAELMRELRAKRRVNTI